MWYYKPADCAKQGWDVRVVVSLPFPMPPLSSANRLFLRFSFSLQVLNSNFPVTDLEVTVDGQTWESTERQDYNYFEREDKSGFGEETVTVRVTCSNGNRVVIPSVSQVPEEEIAAPVNC